MNPLSMLREAFGQWRAKRHREMKLRYAAKQVDLMSPWVPAARNPNDLILDAGPLVRERMRQLVRDFPPFARAVEAIVTYTVGDGIKLQSLVRKEDGQPDQKTRALIEEGWMRYLEDLDASGSPAFRQHGFELMRLGKRQEMDQGETIGVFRWMGPRGRYTPWALALYESERLTEWAVKPLAGNDVKGGVEFEKATGRITAFHFSENGYHTSKAVRVPAEDVVFNFHRQRPGQMRGITPFTPAIILAGKLREFIEAETDAAKMAAKWLAIIKTPDMEGRQASVGVQQDGKVIEELDNAIIEYLEPGEDIEVKGASGRGGPEFEAFSKFLLRLVAVTAGLPYEILTSDYSGLSYTNLRVNRNDFQQQLSPHCQRFAFQFCTPIFRRFLRDAMTAGRLNLPGYWQAPWRYEQASWIWPGMRPIDPLRETKAAVEGFKAGVLSPQEYLLGQGKDPERVLDDYQTWLEMCRTRGLDFSQSLGAVSTSVANNPAAVGGGEED